MTPTTCPCCQAPVTLVLEATEFASTGPGSGGRATVHSYTYAPPVLDAAERAVVVAAIARVEIGQRTASWADIDTAILVLVNATAAVIAARATATTEPSDG